MRKREEKVIYQTYKKFYGKEPNFNRENFMNLTIEIQAMAYILFEYGVNIGGNGFCYEYKDLDMPMSMDIQDIVVGKLMENSADLNDNLFQFNEHAAKIINIIGCAIKCITSNSQEPIEELRKISNILYVKKHVCPSSSDESIMETTKCTQKDLRDVEQLIEFIKQEKCKDNFDRANIENVRKMINEEEITPYGMFVNETGNGERSRITEESRKECARALIR